MPDVPWQGWILATVTWLDMLTMPVRILSKAQVKAEHLSVATIRHLGLEHIDAVTSGKWQGRRHDGLASPVA